MNGYVVAALALMAVANVAEATFIWGTAAATTSAVTLSTGSAVSLGLLGGVVLLKGLVLGAALLARGRGGRRGRRSAENESDAAFAVLTNSEPAQCYQRLICDLAAGAIDDNDQILTLFTEDVSPLSPKFEYATAAKVGKLVKNSSMCEVRYSCPLNSEEIQKLFA